MSFIWTGLENVIEASPAAREQVKEVTSHGGGGVDSSGKKWKVGELEFEALMRLLDNAVSISHKRVWRLLSLNPYLGLPFS